MTPVEFSVFTLGITGHTTLNTLKVNKNEEYFWSDYSKKIFTFGLGRTIE